MLSLKETLDHHKIKITPDFAATKMQREGSQWVRAYEFRTKDIYTQIVYFGDYKIQLNEKWESDTSGYSEEALKEHRSGVKKAEYARRKETEEEQIRVKLEVEAEWPNFIDRGTTEYLQRKKIDSLFGCKIATNDHGAFLIVPARDINGDLWAYQRIYNQKLSMGDKFFKKHSRKQGLFHHLNAEEAPLTNEGVIYVCEGFATAASVAQALKSSIPVICAFDSGNLEHVGRELRTRFPLARIIFVADEDCYDGLTGNRHDDLSRNAGVRCATKAAQFINGEVFRLKLGEATIAKKGTDANDIHVYEGLEVLREQLLSSTATAPLPEIKPKVTEQRIAEAVLKDWEGRLIRQDGDLFRFAVTHWVELKKYDIDQIKNHINRVCKNELPSKTVESIYKTLFRLVPHVPPGVNLFAPNQTCGNFLDGTLHLSLDTSSGIYTLHFSEHKPSDFLTWVIPVKYNCDRTLRNALFDELVSEALEGEEDAAGILRALKQMGGAMLVPTFSQMFFLYGISGSRKSTIALSLAKLVDATNMSHCDPANMENHQIEGLMGKLVNMHTDIDDHTPMPRGFLKRFEDDSPVQVNRKGKTVIDCMLPRVHVYCANNLPPNFEGQGKAFLRRNTLIHFKRDLTHAADGRQLDKVKKHYQNIIWAAGYEGLLNFCLEGLTDLVNSGGKFFQPMSSIEGIQKWQSEKDPVAQFLQGVKAGEVADNNAQVIWGEKRRIKPAQLWEVFCIWHKIVFRVEPRISRILFYRSMMGAGVKKVSIKGAEHYAGIGVNEVESSVF